MELIAQDSPSKWIPSVGSCKMCMVKNAAWILFFFFLRLFERQSYTKGRRGRDLNVDDLLKVATLFNDGIHGEELVERLWVLGGGLCLWGMALIRGLCVSVQVQSVFSLLLPGSPCDQCCHMPSSASSKPWHVALLHPVISTV